MPQQTRFYSYNIIRDEQRDRLRAVATPITAMAPGNGAVLNTYSLYQDINMQQPPAIAPRPSSPPNLLCGDMVNPIQLRTRRRSAETPAEDLTQRPTQRRRHRRVLDDLPPEHKPDLVRKLFAFKDKWNKMFPDKSPVLNVVHYYYQGTESLKLLMTVMSTV